ncbi:hypothetical protein [Thermomonas fusca]|jgi:hypothetical protein
MKIAIFAGVLALSAVGFAHAGCYGSSTYRTCTDAKGNTYSTQKIGNSTYTNGYNSQTGSSWNQSTQRIGNSSYTTGSDAQGNSWNANTQRIGNTTYQSGRDSNGNSFSGQVRKNGSSTTYSGYDSNGNSYQKTCTAYGCY